MTNLMLKILKIDITGATSSECFPAEFIAKVIMLGTSHTRPSLNVLEAALQTYDLPYDRRTTSSDDRIRMRNWIIECRRGRWCVRSYPAFGVVPPPPAMSALLAA